MAADYYELLGVSREASAEEIKRAYRRLAREHHPDVNGGDPQAEETFKRISEAYAVLSDERRRRQYDRGGSSADLFEGGFPDIFEIFESAFGGSPFGGRARRGRSLELAVTLTLEEVLAGTEREVFYTRTALCSACAGQGVEPGSSWRPCTTCDGQGRVARNVNTFLGTMTTVTTCPACSGHGQIPEKICPGCSGQGVERRSEQRTVALPPGVEHGDEVTVRGAGEELPALTPGDLLVRIAVARHPVFTRSGRDLALTCPVSYLQALLGDTLTVPTLTGDLEIPLPAGTAPGERLEVPGEGLPSRGGGSRGRLLVAVEVQIPRRLSPRERELLEELAAESGLEIQPPAKGLFERLRESLGG